MQGLKSIPETGIKRYKTETEKKWKPVLTSKPKLEKIGHRYYNLKPKPKI